MDGSIRIWHKDDKLQPLLTRNFRGEIKDIQWDPKGLGIVMVRSLVLNTFVNYYINSLINRLEENFVVLL